MHISRRKCEVVVAVANLTMIAYETPNKSVHCFCAAIWLIHVFRWLL